MWLEDVATGRIKDPEGEGRKKCQCKPCQKLSRAGGPAASPAGGKGTPSQAKAKPKKAPSTAPVKGTKTKASPKKVPFGKKKRGVLEFEEAGREQPSEDELTAGSPLASVSAPADLAKPTGPKPKKPTKKRTLESDTEASATDSEAGPSAKPSKRARKSAPGVMSSAPVPVKKSSVSLEIRRSESPLPLVHQLLGFKDNNLFTTGDYVYVPVKLIGEDPIQIGYTEDDVLYDDTTQTDIIWWPAKIKTMVPHKSEDGEEKSWKYKVSFLPGEAGIEFQKWDNATQAYVTSHLPEFEECQVRPVLLYNQNGDVWLPNKVINTMSEESQGYYTRACREVMPNKYKATNLNVRTPDRPEIWVIVWGSELIRQGQCVRLVNAGSDLPDLLVVNRIEINYSGDPKDQKEGRLVGDLFHGTQTGGEISWTKDRHPTSVIVPSPDIMGRYYWKMKDNLELFGSWDPHNMYQPPQILPKALNGDDEGTGTDASEMDQSGDQADDEGGAGDVESNDAGGSAAEDGFVDGEEQMPMTQAPAPSAAPVDDNAPFDDVPDNRESEDSEWLPVWDLDSNRRIRISLKSKKVASPTALATQIVKKFSKLPQRGGTEVILPDKLVRQVRKEEIILPTDIGLCYVSWGGNEVYGVRNKNPDSQGAMEEFDKVLANAMNAKVRLGGQRWRRAVAKPEPNVDEDEED